MGVEKFLFGGVRNGVLSLRGWWEVFAKSIGGPSAVLDVKIFTDVASMEDLFVVGLAGNAGRFSSELLCDCADITYRFWSSVPPSLRRSSIECC